MKFPYLLFDADDTLFDFPKAAARAFSAMCRSNGVPDTLDTRALYHRINQELWAAFDRGEVSKDYVTLERFVRFFQALKLPRDPDKCNRDYLTALGAGVYPLPHAEAVCRELVRRGHKLYIVTNAVASVQRSRLQGSVFAALITDAFISEDAGASKPDPAYYAYVRSRIPGLTPENGLVIGDSLSTDIQGANNAGLPCCWYNPAGKARPEDLRIDYVGLNALHLDVAEIDDDLIRRTNEVVLRIAIRTKEKKDAQMIIPEISPLQLNGPPGASFFGGRAHVTDVIGLWPTLIPRDAVKLESHILEVN